MRTPHAIGLSLAFVFAVLPGLCAQTTSLATPYNSNNGQSGNFFDVVATNDISVQGFDVNVDPGTHNFEVYVLPGASWQTANTNAAAWTLVGSYTGIVSAGNDLPTRLGPLTSCVDVPAGTTTGFYVTVANGSGINYTNGTAVGNVLASDANLQILEGAGASYPFGGTFLTRNWNGTLYYFPGLTAGVCLPLPRITTPFQINAAGFEASIGGVVTNGQSAARTSSLLGIPEAVDIVAPAGVPFEAAINPGGTLTANLLRSSAGNVINVDFRNPTQWLYGGVTFQPTPVAGSFSIPIDPNTITSFAAQGFFSDPSQPDGLQITQGLEHEVVRFQSVPGPTTFNGITTYALPGPVDYYGTTYNDIAVIANGRVMMGARGDGDSTATVAEALNDEPFFGYWTYLDPTGNNGGNGVTIMQRTAGVISVEYDQMPYTSTTVRNTFSLEIDTNTGIFTIDGLTGIVDNTTIGTLDAAFLGFSMGSLGATDAGTTTFAPGGGTPGAPTDMLYDFWAGTTAGRVPSLTGGINTLQVLFSGGVPTWVAF